MEQIVKVKSINPDGSAVVVCRRESACGGNCAECGGCGDGKPKMMEVTAQNSIGASPGDRVVLETATGDVLWAVTAVYMIPVVLLIAGCCVAGLWLGLTGLGLGFAGAVALDRVRARKKKLTFTITGYAQE